MLLLLFFFCFFFFFLRRRRAEVSRGRHGCRGRADGGGKTDGERGEQTADGRPGVFVLVMLAPA
jgi:hypothetical protein